MISVLSDVMLTCTIVYYHTMPQKVAGGGLAITSWFITYKLWYKCDSSPGLPGSGLFKYQYLKDKNVEMPSRRKSSLCKEHRDVPKFMGMPITGLRRDFEDKKDKEDCSEKRKWD